MDNIHVMRPIRLLTYSLICLFVYWIIGLLAAPAHAQSQDWVGQGYGTALDQAKMDGAINSDAYITDVTYKNMQAISCGILPVGGESGCSNDPQILNGMLRNSAVGMMSNSIAYMYGNPPADTLAFIIDTGKSLGFIHPVNAQGIGFSGLAPLLPIWKVFRNIAYFLLALVMVAVGFMVMLRKKIDPKTVVTIQNALPQIVITLLLVTFSYAIVGILIDLMYLMILVMVGIFKSTGMLPDPAGMAKLFGYNTPEGLYTQGGNLININNLFGSDLLGWTPGSLSSTSKIIHQILGIDSLAGRALFSGGIIGGLLLAIAAAAGGVTLPFAVPLGIGVAAIGALPSILGLLLSIALLFLVIKLVILFLGSYIQVIISLIFAPIQLVMGALPGSNSFDNWIRNLVSNLLVFPIGAAVFMLAAVFINFANQGAGSIWVPPFTSLVPSSGSAIGALLAIGILFALPNIANQVKEALKPKPFLSAGPETIIGQFAQPVSLALQGWNLWHSYNTTKILSERLPKEVTGGGSSTHKSP